jgi:hypothetical protein
LPADCGRARVWGAGGFVLPVIAIYTITVYSTFPRRIGPRISLTAAR